MDILSFASVWLLIILIITSFILEFFGFVFLIRSILHRKEDCFNKYLKISLLCFLITVFLFNLDKMFEFFSNFSNFRIPFNTFNEIKVVNY